MKILELCLRAFGPFTDFSLDLSGGDDCPGGLHLIYGPNEAGKSTTRRALLGLLFGIPPRSADDHLHDKQDLRVAARLRRADGTEFAFTRRKGNKQTLLDFAGAAPLPDESALTRCLGGTSEESFKTLFCLDHAELVRGGDDILQGKGDVGLALFDASLGGARLRTLLRDLDMEAETFFKRKGINQLISSGLSQYRETRERLRAVTFTGADWQRCDQQKTQADALRRELTARRDAKRAERERLDRLAKAKPALNRRKQLREQLEAFGALPPLPDSFAADRAAAQADERSAAAEAEKRDRELADIKTQAAALEIRSDLLEQAAAIAALGQGVRRFREDAAALPGLRGELAQLEAAIAELMAELWPGQSAETVPSQLLTALQRDAIRRQATEHSILTAAESSTREALETLDLTLNERRGELAALPLARDLAALGEAVRRISKHGDLETASAKARHEQQSAEAEAFRLLGALPPPWRGLPEGENAGAFDALAQLPVPLPESVMRFEQDFSALENRAAQLARDAETCAREIADARRNLDVLRRAGDVPTEEDLATARQRRESHWSMVKTLWLDGQPSHQAIPKHPPPAEELAQTFAENMAAADRLADRLRREADRVARRVELQAALEVNEQRGKAIGAQQAETHAALETLRACWSDLWRASGFAPLSPGEMRSWLRRHEKLCEAIALARNHRQTATLARKAAETASEELRALLPVAVSDAGHLEALLDRAGELLDSQAKLALRRETLEREVDALQRVQRTATERKLQNARDELNAWSQNWSIALQPLTLPRALAPVEAIGMLSQFEALAERRKEAIRCREKITRAEGSLAAFAQEARALLARLRPDQPLAALPPDAVARQLAEQLDQTRAASQTRDALESRRRAAAAARDEAIEKTRAARQKLDHFCRVAGCESPDALEAVEIRWRQAGDIRRSLAEVEDQLFHLSAGQPMESLVEEAAATDADTMPAQLEALAAEIQLLDAQIDASVVEATRAAMELERFGSKADAIRAAEDAENILARLREQTMQYSRLRLAGAVLRREMERYRLENQNPLVRRAGEFFAALTRGSFVGLCVDQDESDKATLRGVRPGQNGGATPVFGMSEGTCDQLYLALRLASLERTVAAQESLPLILDDILINADDDRAGAMLRALHDFSANAQVLLFTHHEHLLALAERELGKAAFTAHRLPARRPAQTVNVESEAATAEGLLALG